jgi:erythromycin esterase
MGSVGEGYSPLMAIMPMAYRVWDSPTELYDGMIFVSKAQPIEVRKAY